MILNIFYLQIENSNICFSNHVLFIFKTVPCPKNEGKKKSKDLIIEENKSINSSDILFDGGEFRIPHRKLCSCSNRFIWYFGPFRMIAWTILQYHNLQLWQIYWLLLYTLLVMIHLKQDKNKTWSSVSNST